MRMKTFQAETMQEALLKVKEELGPEAVILRTRKSGRKLMGNTRNQFEVTAALEDRMFAGPGDANRDGNGKRQPLYNRRGTLPEGTKDRAPGAGRQVPTHKADFTIPEEKFQALLDKLAAPHPAIKSLQEEFKELLIKVSDIKNCVEQLDLDQVTPEFGPLMQALLENDFDANLGRELIRCLEKITPVARRGQMDGIFRNLTRIISNRILSAEEPELKPGRPYIAMVAGPTGAGKTTCIAKLCSLYKLQKNKKVGVISADSYKLGAAEQMQMFCNALDIPMETVFTPEEAEPALRRLSGCDIIFVDTAGRVHTNEDIHFELKRLCEVIRPDEAYLVLSSTTRSRDMLKISDFYQSMAVMSLIFTKLDECSTFGSLYNVCAARRFPVAYISDYQDFSVPIRKVDRDRLAQRILEGVYHCQV